MDHQQQKQNLHKKDNKSTGHLENPYPWETNKNSTAGQWSCCGSVWPKVYYVCPICGFDKPE